METLSLSILHSSTIELQNHGAGFVGRRLLDMFLDGALLLGGPTTSPAPVSVGSRIGFAIPEILRLGARR